MRCRSTPARAAPPAVSSSRCWPSTARRAASTATRSSGVARWADSFAALRALGRQRRRGGRPGYLPAVVEGPLRRRRGRTRRRRVEPVPLRPAAGRRRGWPAGSGSGSPPRWSPGPYVDMTVAVMRAFGAEVDDGRRRRPGTSQPTGYAGTGYAVEPDASAASYAWAAAVVTGGAVTVPGLHRASLQGDVALRRRARAHGGPGPLGRRRRSRSPPATSLHGIDVDMAAALRHGADARRRWPPFADGPDHDPQRRVHPAQGDRPDRRAGDRAAALRHRRPRDRRRPRHRPRAGASRRRRDLRRPPDGHGFALLGLRRARHRRSPTPDAWPRPSPATGTCSTRLRAGTGPRARAV